MTEEQKKPEEALVTISEEEIVKTEKLVESVEKKSFDVSAWQPKTSIGKAVKEGRITDLQQILDAGQKIMEAEIVDALMPDMNVDLLMIGQSKGKFGGGQRRVFKQTQKKTMEGNKPKFSTIALIGNMNGYVGVGLGKAKETVPAREKSVRKAKLNVMKVMRGCGSWECQCGKQHSVPFKVKGKCGSVEVTLIPAPKGTGLKVEPETKKVLQMAGIGDVWSRTHGQTRSKVNMITATMQALAKLNRTKLKEEDRRILSIGEGKRQ
ncbi:30S ribosomal protein S5 [Candidatus Woesearchaeota archaeon]|nr:30S ribosomal protein S5 [Candidatus Woesearchaeota archaeon]